MAHKRFKNIPGLPEFIKFSITFGIPAETGGSVSSPGFRDVAQPGSALAWGARGR